MNHVTFSQSIVTNQARNHFTFKQLKVQFRISRGKNIWQNRSLNMSEALIQNKSNNKCAWIQTLFNRMLPVLYLIPAPTKESRSRLFITEIINHLKIYQMKKLMYVLSVLVLVSCGQHKKEIARMQAKQDSIAQVAVQKNNTILKFIDEMNEIQSNLDSIKKIEKIISIEKASGVEMKSNAKERIAEGIAQINDLLQKNKALAKSLTNKYWASKVKIKELEKTIDNMNKQMAEKNTDIASLTKELKALHINVTNLNQQIETITAENEKAIREKEQAIKEQANVMNTAYYAFGTKKELTDKNVIEKEGGVLGMGKTLTLKKDFDRDYFQKVDIRDFKQLALNVKEAEVLANRPADSYHLSGTKTVEALVIDKPNEFWKASKYLVVVIE